MNFRACKPIAFGLCLVGVTSLAWTAVGECQLPARLFTTGSHTSIRLSAPTWCVNLEPVNNSFQISSIDFTTVYLFSNTYPITGDVDRRGRNLERRYRHRRVSHGLMRGSARRR